MSSYPFVYRSALRLGLLAILVGGILLGCQRTRSLERSLTPPEEAETLDEEAPFLKAHMENGDVYILSVWTMQTDEDIVRGRGHRLGPNRDTLDQGTMRVPIDSVAIFETNTTQVSGSVVAMSVLTGASLALTGVCAANPKACFGSCPTFYAPAGADTLLQAEGFSSSIAPSLERTDVDALYRAEAGGSTIELRMTNEALETHVVRSANLLAVPRPKNGRVFRAGNGTFWAARTLRTPMACTAPEGDCRPQVAHFDGRERYSRADSTDLATKERITLTFDAVPQGPVGLVVGARQTLLTTFLLYQTLAYMGEDIGSWLAMLERNENNVRSAEVKNILGAIEVWVPTTEGGWKQVGTAGEHGPIATDTHLVPLPRQSDSTRTVQLRLTKGNWRLDFLALAALDAQVEPVRISPSAVLRGQQSAPEARAQLVDSTRTLVTLPGDVYTLSYDLPDDGPHELFLESRGYYLEWMRDTWMQETDPDRVAAMLFSPDRMMKTLAPAFKSVEPHMEEAFWNSRYER
jgi:hypothetical protein